MSIRTLHVPFGYHPDSVGGTEIYVGGLVRELIRSGHPAVIAAPGNADASYTHEGLPVRRFGMSAEAASVADLYGGGDETAAAAFGRTVDDVKPDVVHLHALTRACSIRLVEEAHARRIPVVFTYHTPTVSCVQGTLIECGDAVCDGRMEVARCTTCTLHRHGIDRRLARLVAHAPAMVGTLGRELGGRPGTALQMPTLVQHAHATVRQLFREVDRIVALRQWVVDLLAINGVDPDRIFRSQHTLCQPPSRPQRRDRVPGPLRIAFLGRLDRTKGIDVVIRAIGTMPTADLQLDIFAPTQGAAGERERQIVQRLADADARVSLFPPVAPGDVVDVIAAHDLLVVPSQWLETGPLVVLEAFAANVPVVGSAIGGIAEMVRPGVNGVLVERYQEPSAWADALRPFGDDPSRLAPLASGISPPPAADVMAKEMLTLYRDVLATSPPIRRQPIDLASLA